MNFFDVFIWILHRFRFHVKLHDPFRVIFLCAEKDGKTWGGSYYPLVPEFSVEKTIIFPLNCFALLLKTTFPYKCGSMTRVLGPLDLVA